MKILSELSTIVRNVCATFLDTNELNRNYDVIEKRFGLLNKEALTLQEIGDKYNLTRERVRQIESKIINILSILFNEGSYTKKFVRKQTTYTLEQDLYQEVILFKEAIKEYNIFLPLDTLSFLNTLKESYKGELDLLLECLNYTPSPYNLLKAYPCSIKSGWVAMSERKMVEKLIHDINHLLKAKLEFNRSELNAKFPSFYINNIGLIIDGIALKDENILMLSFNKLTPLNKAYYLLKEYKQLHIDELMEKINEVSSVEVTSVNLRNQMSADKERFKPIGKSGIWVLTEESDLENISILQALKQILTEANKPLHISEIYEGIKNIRGDSFLLKSVKIYLNTNESFISTAKDMYALSNSIYTEREKRNTIIDNELFYSKLLSILPINEVKYLNKVVSAFKLLGFHEPTIRTKIKDLIKKGFIVDVSLSTERNKRISLVSDDVEAMLFKLKDNKMNRLQRIIISILEQKNISKIKKGELYHLVNDIEPCLRATFYASLAKIEDKRVSSLEENNHYYVLFDNSMA